MRLPLLKFKSGYALDQKIINLFTSPVKCNRRTLRSAKSHFQQH